MSEITFKIKCYKNSPSVTVHGDVLKPYLGERRLKWFRVPTETPELVSLEFPNLNNFQSDNNDDSLSENDGNNGETRVDSEEIAGRAHQ